MIVLNMCAILNAIMLLLLITVLLVFSSDNAKAGDIIVPANQTVEKTTTDASEYTDKLEIYSGGTLYVYDGYDIHINNGATLRNNGDIKLRRGGLYLTGDQLLSLIGRVANSDINNGGSIIIKGGDTTGVKDHGLYIIDNLTIDPAWFISGSALPAPYTIDDLKGASGYITGYEHQKTHIYGTLTFSGTANTLKLDFDYGKIYTLGLNLAKETTVANGNIYIESQDTNLTHGSIYGKKLILGNDNTKPNVGTYLNLGDQPATDSLIKSGRINADIHIINGLVSINTGDWVLASGNTITVGDDGIIGFNAVGGSVASFSLEKNAKLVFNSENGNVTINGTFSTGIIHLTDYDYTYSSADFNKVYDQFFSTGDGIILGNISGILPDQSNEISYSSIPTSLPAQFGANFEGNIIVNTKNDNSGNTYLSGVVGMVGLDENVTELSIGTNLTIAGADDRPYLITLQNGDSAGALLRDNASLTLGTKGVEKNIKDITFDSSNATAYIAGNITTEKVETKTDKTGSLVIQSGSKLSIKNGTNLSDIGTDKMAIKELVSDFGELNANNVYAYNMNAKGGKLEIKSSLVLKDDSVISNGIVANINTLEGAAGKKIEVGQDDDYNTETGTTVKVDKLVLNSGMLLVDPAWGLPSTTMYIKDMDRINSTSDIYHLNGNVGVGQNSYLAIGTPEYLPSGVTNDTLEKLLPTIVGPLSEGNIVSALGIFSPIQLSDSTGLSVNSEMGSTLASSVEGGKIHFANNTMLVVSAKAAKEPAGAISAAKSTSAYIGAGAKLKIVGAKVSDADSESYLPYTILGNNIEIADNGNDNAWVNNRLSADSDLIILTGEWITSATNKKNLRIKISTVSANTWPKIDSELARIVDDVIQKYDINETVYSSKGGLKFISRAINTGYIGSDHALAARTIESAARVATLGAAPQMTRIASDAAMSAATQRLSLANPMGGGMMVQDERGTVNRAVGDDMSKNGLALWIMPLYQSHNAWGMKAGNFKMDWHGGLGGVSVGADYTAAGMVRVGLSASMGGGYSEGSGELAKTTNNFTYWGIGAYGGFAVNHFSAVADVNYTGSYSTMRQAVPDRMRMADLEADIQGYALSAGVKLEYKVETPGVDIVPHAGARYMHLATHPYDVKSDGNSVLHADAVHHDIWTFPVGVAFVKDIETGNGWRVKPSVDLVVIPAAGDVEGRSRVRFTGINDNADLRVRVMDYIAYQGTAGLEFGKNDVWVGLNYSLLVSEHTTSHGIFGTLRMEF
ncbi:MAG: autotransporter outer membrane beta-barrel domain-containing protein [Desulfovibrio sp.]|nr:autotransporter outer membrane beta-barrel domain-containing protein [Desulfovibrio sp.]